MPDRSDPQLTEVLHLIWPLVVKGVTGAVEKKVLLFGLAFREGGQLFQPLW